MNIQGKLPFFLSALLAVTLGLGLPLRIASGHAGYDHSEPASDAVMATAPAQVRIWFTQELFRRQGMNQIEVVDATGTRVDQDDVTIDDDDRTLMQVTLAPDLPNGVYTVRWQSLSAEDGHEGQGEFTFTVGDAAPADVPVGDAAPQAAASPTTTSAPAATASPAPPATPPPATPSPALPCLGGAAPLLLALGAVLTRRRN